MQSASNKSIQNKHATLTAAKHGSDTQRERMACNSERENGLLLREREWLVTQRERMALILREKEWLVMEICKAAHFEM